MLEVMESDEICLSCSNRKCKTRKIKINRSGGSKPGENITSFSLCDECFSKLISELRLYEIIPKIDINIEYDKEMAKEVLEAE